MIVFSLQIAAEVSAPLVKTEEIVLLGDDRTTSEVSRLLSNLPPAVNALTGVDLSKVGYLIYSCCRITITGFVLIREADLLDVLFNNL